MRTIFGVLRTGASILWERFEKCSWTGSSIFGSSEACPLPHKHPRSDSSAHDYLTSILGFIKTSPHLLNGSSLSSGIIRYYQVLYIAWIYRVLGESINRSRGALGNVVSTSFILFLYPYAVGFPFI